MLQLLYRDQVDNLDSNAWLETDCVRVPTVEFTPTKVLTLHPNYQRSVFNPNYANSVQQ